MTVSGSARSKTSSSSRGPGPVDDTSGQATVEAAVLVPVAMVMLALLLQPVCLLYTCCVMRTAAAEGARVLATARGEGDDEACEAYVRRRLAAVPDVSIFHEGGEGDWEVSLGGPGSSVVSVKVTGHARPLPILGVVAGVFGEVDGSGIVLRSEIEEEVRPSWLEGSYGDWVAVWGS